MKRILIVKEIINGIVRIIKSLNCKLKCCCESSCNQHQIEEEKINHYEL
jgi:hypothetical protein